MKKSIKYTLIGLMSLGGVSLITFSTVFGILKHKNAVIRKRDEKISTLNAQIQVLKSEIELLKDENTKLKNNVDALENVLKITNAIKDSSNSEINGLLTKLVNNTDENIKNSEYLEYIIKHTTKLKESNIANIELLLHKLEEIQNNNPEKYKNSFINTKIIQLQELIKNVEELQFSNSSEIKENIKSLNDFTAHYQRLNEELIIELNSLINSKNDEIAQLNLKINTTGEKLEKTVLTSIKTAKNQLESIDVMIEYVILLKEKSLKLISDKTNEDFVLNLTALLRSLSEYKEFLNSQITASQTSLNKAIQDNDYNDLITLDTDIYASKIKYWTQLLQNYNNLALDIYLAYYESTLKDLSDKEKEIDTLQIKNQQLTNDLNAAVREKAQAMANLKKLKEDLLNSFRNSLTSIIDSLQNISLTIENSDSTNKNELVQKLNIEIDKLRQLRSEFTDESFVSKYEPFVESALSTADEVIEEYKNTVLNPLKEEFQLTKITLDNTNKELIEAKELLKSKTLEIEKINDELSRARTNLDNKEIQFRTINKELNDTKEFLSNIRKQKNTSLVEMSHTIDQFEQKYNELKSIANQIINESIKEHLDVAELQSLITKVFRAKNVNSFEEMNSLSKEYLNHYSITFTKMLDLYKQLSEKRLITKDLLIANKDSNIEKLNSTIANLENEQNKILSEKLQLEEEIERGTFELGNSTKIIQNLEDQLRKTNKGEKTSVVNPFLDEDMNQMFSFKGKENLSWNDFNKATEVESSIVKNFNLVSNSNIEVFYFNKDTSSLESVILSPENNYSKRFDLSLRNIEFTYDSKMYQDFEATHLGSFTQEVHKTYNGKILNNSSSTYLSYVNGVLRISLVSKLKVQRWLEKSSDTNNLYEPIKNDIYSFMGGSANPQFVFVYAIAKK